jgi:hypothetical protein
LEEDYPISPILKRNPVLAERTQLNSIQEEGTKKEVSEENAGPSKEIERKQVEEEKDFNKENKTKNEMGNSGATEAVNPKKRTTQAVNPADVVSTLSLKLNLRFFGHFDSSALVHALTALTAASSGSLLCVLDHLSGHLYRSLISHRLSTVLLPDVEVPEYLPL